MKRLKKILLYGFVTIFLATTLFAVPTIWFTPWSINHFYMRVFLEFALDHPMLLSQLRVLEPMGLEFHNDDLDDNSLEFMDAESRRAVSNLKILRSYSTNGMTPVEKLSRDVMEWFLADAVEGDRFRFHNYPLNQVGGIQSGLPNFLLTVHHINKPKDAENYITRTSKVDTYFDRTLTGLQAREERGIIPPRWVIGKVVAEMREFIAVPATVHTLYTHFRESTEEMEGLDATGREEMSGRLAAVIEAEVYPAYGRLIEYYADLETRATNDDGVWKLPDGEAFYAYQLRNNTTTTLSAEEIHVLGLQELERIHAEMRKILEAEGIETEDLGATLRALHRDARFLYEDSDAGRDQILADYQAIIDEIDGRLEGLFSLRPEFGVQVKRVPEFMQATAPGAYYQAAPMDGSKPGTFYVNLRDVAEIPRFGMRTLAYHEAIPGHHFQIGIAQGLTGLPFFRRIIPFTAYSEGWALYAEKAAAEHGFQDDPFDKLGYLVSDAFRATRLVVDTGIHHKRWTREEAIEFMLDSTGMPEGDVVVEIERYIVWPGQACAYKVGQLKILELRERARERLGDRFDIEEFHSVMLTNGALPMALLERVVDLWLAKKPLDLSIAAES